MMSGARIKRIIEIVVNIKLVTGSSGDKSDIRRDTLCDLYSLVSSCVVRADVSTAIDAHVESLRTEKSERPGLGGGRGRYRFCTLAGCDVRDCQRADDEDCKN